MRRRHLVVWTWVALFSACRGEDPAPPAVPAPAAPSQETGAAALRAPSGESPADDALRRAQAHVRTLPADADRWVALGKAWIRKARNAQIERLYDRAEVAARRAMALKPGHPGARRLLALVHRNAHRFAAMRAETERLVAEAPRDPEAWGLLGDAALELGDYPAAEKAYEQMIGLQPGLPSFVRAAWLRWLHGDVDGALELWREAARVAPRHDVEPKAWVLSEIGHLEWHRGALDAAQAAYDAALTLKPDHGPSLFGRGRVWWARGDAAAAVRDLAASARARRAEPTFEWLAAAQRAAGDAPAAEKTAALLRAEGSYDDPRSVALYLATQRVDAETAIRLARADMKARGDLFAADALGFALLRAGKPAEAAPHIEAALKLGTPDASLHAHGGLLAVAQGDVATARLRLERALALNPSFHPVLAPEVKAVLAALPKASP